MAPFRVSEIDFRQAELSLSAQKFIATFVRFEFALKENGYCTGSGAARVEWSCVANGLGSRFYENVVASQMARTILLNPPKKQIAQYQMLDWQTQSPPNNVSELLEAVRRVRNNQFHGGKSGHPDDDLNDIARREKLVSEAQWIVERILCEMPSMKASFEGRY